MTPAELNKLRDAELDVVLEHFPSGGVVLEIGAGSGYQARRLRSLGYSVTALEIEVAHSVLARLFPVQEYDGRTLPLASGSVDVVFSSNVLEHIRDLSGMQAEIARVLRPDGSVIHLVPSSTWRLWTSVLHYAHYLKKCIAVRRLAARVEGDSGRKEERRRISKILFAERHGEHGTAVQELFLFSRYQWRARFERSGFRIESCYGSGLYYSGYGILGGSLSIRVRRLLASLLGSSCHVFVLRRL